MKGVVAAGHPLTAEAGARALREGGNAFDAAVAAVLASFATESPLTGLGAGGFLMAHVEGEGDHLLDFFVEAGGRGADPGDRTELVALEVLFEDVRVPAANLIGEVDKGMHVALGTLDHSRLGVAAQAVGIAQGAIDHAAAYANERRQFGSVSASRGRQTRPMSRMSRCPRVVRNAILGSLRVMTAFRPTVVEWLKVLLFSTPIALAPSSTDFSMAEGLVGTFVAMISPPSIAITSVNVPPMSRPITSHPSSPHRSSTDSRPLCAS